MRRLCAASRTAALSRARPRPRAEPDGDRIHLFSCALNLQQSVAGQVPFPHEMGPGACTCNTVEESEKEPQLSCVLVGVAVGAGVDGALAVLGGVPVGVAVIDAVPVSVGVTDRLAPSVTVAVAERLRGPALVARAVGDTSGAV